LQQIIVGLQLLVKQSRLPQQIISSGNSVSFLNLSAAVGKILRLLSQNLAETFVQS
jgi:hypothetical protein